MWWLTWFLCRFLASVELIFYITGFMIKHIKESAFFCLSCFSHIFLFLKVLILFQSVFCKSSIKKGIVKFEFFSQKYYYKNSHSWYILSTLYDSVKSVEDTTIKHIELQTHLTDVEISLCSLKQSGFEQH